MRRARISESRNNVRMPAPMSSRRSEDGGKSAPAPAPSCTNSLRLDKHHSGNCAIGCGGSDDDFGCVDLDIMWVRNGCRGDFTCGEISGLHCASHDEELAYCSCSGSPLVNMTVPAFLPPNLEAESFVRTTNWCAFGVLLVVAICAGLSLLWTALKMMGYAQPPIARAEDMKLLLSARCLVLIGTAMLSGYFGPQSADCSQGMALLPVGSAITVLGSLVIVSVLLNDTCTTYRLRWEEERTRRHEAKLCAELASKPGAMTVFVTPLTGQKIEVAVNPTDQIDDIKRKIHGKEGIDHRQQVLMLDQRELVEGTVRDNSIVHGASLHLILGGLEPWKHNGQVVREAAVFPQPQSDRDGP